MDLTDLAPDNSSSALFSCHAYVIQFLSYYHVSTTMVFEDRFCMFISLFPPLPYKPSRIW